MHHKQCSLLGKLSLHGGTVIASCLYLASRTRSHHTILQGGFSNSPGWNLLPPCPADVEACLTQINCSSLHLPMQGPQPQCVLSFLLLPNTFFLNIPKFSLAPFSSIFKDQSCLPISVFVTHLVLPADPLGKTPAPPNLAPHS